jgi:parallel beta-helix repeat protein
LHSLKIEDFDNGGGDKGLSGFIFSFDNGTGNFINDSWIPFNSNPDWSNITKTVGSIELTTIRWKVYANDTSGNTGSSDVFIYVLNGITNCITLNKSGRYYLINDIINSYATTCINIISNDIIFDCGGHTIDRTIFLLESSVGIQVYRIGLNDTNITIKNCVITNWRSRGVRLYYSGRNNLTNLNISGAVTGAGVDLSNANNNFITNVKSSSNLEGTFIHESSNNIFSNNIFNDNSCEGIGLAVNSHDNIINNNIINSNGYGIYLYSSSTDNFIYNNLFNNTVNYYNETNYFNYWNITQQEGSRIYSDGTNIGGNYWTNSSGNDYSDICLDVDKDGFCDNYYNLFSLNIDYLPLSNKYIEPIIPIWYISAPENGTIINEQYFDIEVGYNLTDYPTYEIGSLGIFLCNYDVEVCNYDNSFKQIYSEDEYFRTYIEDGTYFYFVELYIFETGNPENEFVFYTEIKSLTMNGSYEKLYIFYTEENIVNGSEINNNTLNLYWNYNGTLNIWEIIYTSIEIQKDLGEGYEIIDGIYFEGTETTSAEINFLNYTGDYRFVMYMEVVDNESNFYGFYEDTQTLYYTILGLPEEELEIPEEEIDFNIEGKIFMIITILIIFSIAIFLFNKFGKKGMSKIGKSKLSIFLIMFFALSLKVFAVTNNYAMESNLLTIVTIILIFGLIYFLYQKIFKKE